MKVLNIEEEVTFFDYSPNPMKVKIDTGAAAGALHAEDIKVIEKDGEYVLSFRPFGLPKTVEKDCFHALRVRSSNGEMQQRFTVLTKIKIAGELHTIRISLTDRSKMSYEAIIGRNFLRKKFLVDPR